MTDTIREAMLYDNYRQECHTQQVHWREKKMVTNRQSLITQMNRRQRASGRDWTNVFTLSQRFWHKHERLFIRSNFRF